MTEVETRTGVLEDENRRLRAEVDAAYELLKLHTGLRSIPAPAGESAGAMDAPAPQWWVEQVGRAMVEVLEEHAAANYLEWQVQDSPRGPLALTLQCVAGETPGQQATAAKAEVVRLREALTYYADADGYDPTCYHGIPGNTADEWDDPPVFFDRGEVARQALAAKGETP